MDNRFDYYFCVCTSTFIELQLIRRNELDLVSHTFTHVANFRGEGKYAIVD